MRKSIPQQLAEWPSTTPGRAFSIARLLRTLRAELNGTLPIESLSSSLTSARSVESSSPQASRSDEHMPANLAAHILFGVACCKWTTPPDRRSAVADTQPTPRPWTLDLGLSTLPHQPTGHQTPDTVPPSLHSCLVIWHQYCP